MKVEEPAAPPPPYDPSADREREYDEQVAPLMAVVIDRCRALGIPMVCAFRYAGTAEGDMLGTFISLPEGASGVLVKIGSELSPDVLASTVPEREVAKA